MSHENMIVRFNWYGLGVRITYFVIGLIPNFIDLILGYARLVKPKLLVNFWKVKYNYVM